MAASGVMADFARMPTSRKVLVFAVIGMFLGLVYFRLVYKGLKEEVEAAEATYESNKSTNAKLEADLPKYRALRDSMAVLQQQIDENQKALPTEAEVPAFFETLERKVRESGVEITKWTKKNEEPIESFVKVPVEIEITGTFMQLKRFFASLVQKTISPTSGDGEERERIVSIESLVLSQPQVRNREIVLNAKFTAVTFRQEDKATVPAKPGAPAPAAPAPAPAPAPAAAPLPSAQTPAGAKARVEDSLDKGGETRVERSPAGGGR